MVVGKHVLPIFAYCGSLGNLHLTAKKKCLLPSNVNQVLVLRGKRSRDSAEASASFKCAQGSGRRRKAGFGVFMVRTSLTLRFQFCMCQSCGSKLLVCCRNSGRSPLSTKTSELSAEICGPCIVVSHRCQGNMFRGWQQPR